jgi:hypothetical protein
MKKTITFLFAILIASFSYGQIDKNLKKANWKPGKEKVLYGNTIVRHLGKNTISGMTNLGYQTFEQVISEVNQKANDEMWTAEKKNKTIEAYQKFSAGGILHLYLTRLTIDAANTKMFTVIVKDSEDNNEIFRKELKSNIANTPTSGSDYWWNYASIHIPEKINGKVFIYIIDRLGRDNNKFKFEMVL